MRDRTTNDFYIYPTQGVCPPEIHFRVVGGRLRDVRFVGGGCPGNAALVSRLIDNRPVEEILPLLEDIECRNGTSCPDQLAKALRGAIQGRLRPADTFRVHTDPQPVDSIAFIGDLSGNRRALERILGRLRGATVDKVYIVGNLTGVFDDNKDVIRIVRNNKLLAILGERDWKYARKTEENGLPAVNTKDRDWLARQPHVVCFSLAGRCGVIFFGDYIQRMPGYSDYEPFALEMNMVCGLTDFMRDESVFPALQAMTPQFEADIVVFSQVQRWGHWQVGGKDFISLGAAVAGGETTWGLLTTSGDGIRFDVMREPL